MNPSSGNPVHDVSAPHTYRYLGGTVHLTPWAAALVAVTFVWLIWFVGGPRTFSSPGTFIAILGFFVAFPIILAVYTEWTLRNRPGQVVVDDRGISAILPWGRQRSFRWNEIHEVRCVAVRFSYNFTFWEICGPRPGNRILITWELKGYKELLATIKARATHCQRFDAIPGVTVGKTRDGSNFAQDATT